MFDTMTMTKAVAGVCGALLVFLLGNWVATSLYAMGGGHGGGHGEEGELAQAYTVDTGASGGESAGGEEATVDVAALLAAGDAAAGEKVFGKCKACHKVDGANATGPHLNGVVGRPVASVADFSYSDGMKAHGGDWTPEALEAFLTNPKGVVPGTKMSFAGLAKVEDRANVIAYLQSLGG